MAVRSDVNIVRTLRFTSPVRTFAYVSEAGKRVATIKGLSCKEGNDSRGEKLPIRSG